jgi:dipeptidyl aminopeptidase/acylaminoacyl peptidase
VDLLGRAYPELAAEKMARLRWIHYPAQDGTTIPGYLTIPKDAKPEKLPLIVMPHGGPIHRDTFEFDFLRQFLANRGYAVLQMNFRGSSGYGTKWLRDAHQDWGGLTYSDITDGARWAIAQGIADPNRVCILGWSFGGYAALLGAVRNSDLYRCSVSIAGVSDLRELLFDEKNFANSAIAALQIGTDSDKLKNDSPRLHAAEINIPVLLIHGDRDFQVYPHHSNDMAKALKRAGKKYQYLEIDGGTHQLWRESERITLLQSVEKFLAENLGAP